MIAKKIFRDHLVNLIIASLFILGFAVFEFWDHYIPSAVQDRNKSEISRIKVDPTDFYFAVFGDHKGHDAYFEPLLRDLDHDKQIAFAIEAGDLLREGRRWFYRRLLNQIEKNLSIPFLAIIGNMALSVKIWIFHKTFLTIDKIATFSIFELAIAKRVYRRQSSLYPVS